MGRPSTPKATGTPSGALDPKGHGAPPQRQVVVVEQYGVRAGGQVVAEQLMRHFGDLGRSALLLAPDGPWPTPDASLPVMRISTRWRDLLSDVRLVRGLTAPGTLVIANGPRVVHHVILVGLTRRGVRTALLVHNGPHHSRLAPLQRLYLKVASRAFDVRVAVAGVLAPMLAAPVSVLHNCCRKELELSADEIRSRYPGEGRLTVKTLFRDDPVKGFAVYEAAVAAMSEQERSTVRALASKGPSIHTMRMDEEGAAGAVELVPGMDARWFQPGDVVCVPSFHEFSPLVVMEAMARGAVVVASSVGGVPEIVDHGRNGFLVTAGDVQGLRRCLVALADLPAGRRLELALAGRATVDELAGQWHRFWEQQSRPAWSARGDGRRA